MKSEVCFTAASAVLTTPSRSRCRPLRRHRQEMPDVLAIRDHDIGVGIGACSPGIMGDKVPSIARFGKDAWQAVGKGQRT